MNPRCILVATMSWAGVVACASAIGASAFSLTSPDFKAGERLPEKFILNFAGCSGGNSSPALEWHGTPPGTKSFAITLFDPDEHGTPSGWWHWVVFDLPATTARLGAGAGSGSSSLVPPGSQQGRTDLGTKAYHGPCPSPGNSPHHYVFTIYALKVAKLPVPSHASGAMVTLTAHDYTLAEATLVAVYGR